ncbi:hypothetical protein HYC85_002761 [Camellia sinensis]|uniref:Actin-related protein 2 n=1 Tax=Camellia sinensis TaxID=4442 RepID=A0A7J7I985_CAMSI|nr:hypothetical protein HYC85_002761 [Camellia sinensis]
MVAARTVKMREEMVLLKLKLSPQRRVSRSTIAAIGIVSKLPRMGFEHVERGSIGGVAGAEELHRRRSCESCIEDGWRWLIWRMVGPKVEGRPWCGKGIVVGEACLDLWHQLDISYPVNNGIVQNWDDMGHVWDHAFFNELKIDPTKCKILPTDPPLNPSKNREKMVETMFEKYNFAGVFIQIQAVLTLWIVHVTIVVAFIQRLLTGLVIDSGDGVTHVVNSGSTERAISIVTVVWESLLRKYNYLNLLSKSQLLMAKSSLQVPVVDGYSFPYLTKRTNVAGRHITSCLVYLLQRGGYAMNSTTDFKTVRDIKEKLCYLSYDYKREYQLGLETTIPVKNYTGNGRVIKVGTERFHAPDALFTPELIDVEGDGMADMVFRCIQEMDIDNRMMLYQYIIVSGGSIILEKEILDRYLEVILKGNKDGLKKLHLRIEDPPQRKYMVYLGGAVIAGIMKAQHHSHHCNFSDKLADNRTQIQTKSLQT